VLAPTDPHAQLQALQPVQASNPLAVDTPTLTAQQHGNALITEPRSCVREIPDAHRQRRLIARGALAVPRRAGELGKPTRANGADLKSLLNPGD
jgi:hypothetical protein